MNFINTLRDLTLNNKTDTESTPPPTDVAPIPGPEPNTQSPCDPPQVADPTEAVDSIPQTTDPIVNPSGTVTSPTYEPTTSPHNRTGPIIAGYYANWYFFFQSLYYETF
jgi:hypothetical protein